MQDKARAPCGVCFALLLEARERTCERVKARTRVLQVYQGSLLVYDNTTALSSFLCQDEDDRLLFFADQIFFENTQEYHSEFTNLCAFQVQFVRRARFFFIGDRMNKQFNKF